MSLDKKTALYYEKDLYRIIWGLAGLMLTALGLFVMFFGVVELPIRIIIGIIMTLIGTEAIWSSLKSKQSLLAQFAFFF